MTPRIVAAGDENRLAGVPALPFDLNPYRDSYGEARTVSAALVPSPGVYDVVFDTASRSRAGPFSFRLWIDDTTPPRARLLTRVADPVGELVVAVSDGGSGVDPRSIRARIDGDRVSVKGSATKTKVLLDGHLARGTHTTRLPGVRLPGDEELREHQRLPSEHDHPASIVSRALSDVLAVLALLDRRQTVEIPPNARGELVPLGRDDLQM